VPDGSISVMAPPPVARPTDLPTGYLFLCLATCLAAGSSTAVANSTFDSIPTSLLCSSVARGDEGVELAHHELGTTAVGSNYIRDSVAEIRPVK
jgi:hypothetical protein